MVTDIVEAALATEFQGEVISTEELLAQVDILNENWKSEGFNVSEDTVTVSSLYTEALYPSLDVRECSNLCGDLVCEYDLKIQSVDYKWACTYIALNCTQAKITRANLQEIVPKRCYNRGPRPGKSNADDVLM